MRGTLKENESVRTSMLATLLGVVISPSHFPPRSNVRLESQTASICGVAS